MKTFSVKQNLQELRVGLPRTIRNAIYGNTFHLIQGILQFSLGLQFN